MGNRKYHKNTADAGTTKYFDYSLLFIIIFLVLFGLVCTIQAVRTGILRQSIEADTFLGVLFGVMVLLICVWTKQLGAADGIIILFLGLVGGIVRILGIFLAALLLMGLCGLILMMTGRVDKKTSMPVIPFVFLAVVWRGL